MISKGSKSIHNLILPVPFDWTPLVMLSPRVVSCICCALALVLRSSSALSGLEYSLRSNNCCLPCKWSSARSNQTTELLEDTRILMI